MLPNVYIHETQRPEVLRFPALKFQCNERTDKKCSNFAVNSRNLYTTTCFHVQEDWRKCVSIIIIITMLFAFRLSIKSSN